MATTTNQRPNILSFLPDQWRPDLLGFGATVAIRTPTVDRLAASGTVFTRPTTPLHLVRPPVQNGVFRSSAPTTRRSKPEYHR